MRLFISHFSAWIVALASIVAGEVWFDHAYHPSLADRSNFVSYGLQDNFVPDQMEQILYQKLRMDSIPKPDFVQVGDSSGFFGIIPEIVEEYLPGMKYLNASCCATQGFNGYLALLQFNLRRFPSIKYMVVHSGIIAAFPGPLQWRNAPKSLAMGNGVTLNTLGENMETHLIPPWNLLDLPTNSLRQTVLQKTFLDEALRDSVNVQTGAFEIIINGLQSRQGYGLEQDHQNVGGHADIQRCQTIKHETFFDWASLRRKSYLDAFVEEYVALARKFSVTPIFVFQISPCLDPGSNDVAAMRENLKKLQERFPELKVPFDVIDTYPENDFSVLLHVQRDVSEETSRRLGRALREIVVTNNKLDAGKPPANSTLTVMKATRVDTCDHESDITDAFSRQCNGDGKCDVDLNRWRQPPGKEACKATYIAEFRCTGGPSRIVRQETEDRFGGRFRLDCQMHDRWERDGFPRGIKVADASLGGRGGSPMGLVTLRAKAFCDGLRACEYTIKAPDAVVKTGNFSVRWYCGSKQKILSVPDAQSGTRAHIECP